MSMITDAAQNTLSMAAVYSRPWDEKASSRKRQDAGRIRLLAHRTGRAELLPRLRSGADAAPDAEARGVWREVHDRLPRRVPRQLVHTRKAVPGAARSEPELLRRERLPVTLGLASQWMDPQAGPARLVPVV